VVKNQWEHSNELENLKEAPILLVEKNQWGNSIELGKSTEALTLWVGMSWLVPKKG